MIELRVHTFSRPEPALLSRAARFRTPDAVNAVGNAIAADPAIRAVWGAPRVVGSALTVRTPPRDNYGPAVAPMFAEAGDVLVVDTGGDASVAVAGGLIGRLARLRGVAGLVIDGAVRDVGDFEALGLPVFARAVAPRRAVKRGPGEIGGRVVVGGVEVGAGDLVIADRDGVAFVPRAELEESIAAIEAEIAREKDLESDAAVLAFFDEMLAKAKVTRG